MKLVGAAVGSLAVIVSSLWGSFTYLDGRYAHQTDLLLVEMRLDQKIQSDQVNQMQQRQWKIEDQYGRDLKGAPDTVKEEYRQLDKEKREAQRELDALYQHQRGRAKK